MCAEYFEYFVHAFSISHIINDNNGDPNDLSLHGYMLLFVQKKNQKVHINASFKKGSINQHLVKRISVFIFNKKNQNGHTTRSLQKQYS